MIVIKVNVINVSSYNMKRNMKIMNSYRFLVFNGLSKCWFSWFKPRWPYAWTWLPCLSTHSSFWRLGHKPNGRWALSLLVLPWEGQRYWCRHINRWFRRFCFICCWVLPRLQAGFFMSCHRWSLPFLCFKEPRLLTSIVSYFLTSFLFCLSSFPTHLL